MSRKTQSKQKGKKSSPNLSQQPLFVDHRHGLSLDNISASARCNAKVEERMPTFLTADAERQGRDTKVPELVQWARDCPVSWTNKITSDKLNVVLFTWSFVSSLLAARTGRSPDLEQGELEARLQHLLHVLEVTLQTSTSTEYLGDSWKVANLYHTKVQQKVDNKQATWVQLMEMHHNATLPHELMAATQELAIKPRPRAADVRNVGSKTFDGRNNDGKGGSKEGEGRKKRVCSSWNRSEIRGKCNYETEYPGEKCKYLHECLWCRSKGKTPATHQRFFCTKRLEAEEE